jgi:hypothetical protein
MCVLPPTMPIGPLPGASRQELLQGHERRCLALLPPGAPILILAVLQLLALAAATGVFQVCRTFPSYYTDIMIRRSPPAVQALLHGDLDRDAAQALLRAGGHRQQHHVTWGAGRGSATTLRGWHEELATALSPTNVWGARCSICGWRPRAIPKWVSYLDHDRFKSFTPYFRFGS